jgi:predicted Zn-dependent protease
VAGDLKQNGRLSGCGGTRPAARLRAVAFLAGAWLAVGALSGCASLDTGTHVAQKHPAPPKADAEFTPATLREHERILNAYGGAYESPRAQKYVSQTVERLVAASERPDLHYRVTLLNSPGINAFALPNGHLYVTRGLLALANDRAELASVLAHEMSHVIARHAAIREDRARQAALVSQVVSDVLSDPEIGALALAKSKIALATFSRAQEFEADGIGVGISARAGFDPFGAERFLQSLDRNATMRSNTTSPPDPHSVDFLSSHPSTPARIQNAITIARQYSAPGSGERNKAEYLAQINGLTYGEDPTEGYVRGRRYLHPKLGFTFTAPENFTLDNTAHAVLGLGDGGTQALRVDVVRVPIEQSLPEYLASGWIENVDKSSAEIVTINGFQAATATAKSEQWTFRLYAIRFGTDVYRFVFASQRSGADVERTFRESVGTFRKMTSAEIAAAKPLRLRIVTVRPGDTPERFAQQMSFIDRPLERFRLLNGLEPGAALKPGDAVKLVVE